MKQAGLWYRDGNLLYRLRHWGWRKGVEQFENETTVLVQGKDSEALAKDVLDYLCTTGKP